MFKSITHTPLKNSCDELSNTYTHHYHLIDSEFECSVSATFKEIKWSSRMTAVPLVANQYHKRNLPIISNLYLLNNYALNSWYSGWSFKELVDYQNQYIDKYYPILGISFSKDIYPKLLEMHEELSVYK